MSAFLSETFDGTVYVSEFTTKESVKDIVTELTQDDFILCLRLATEALKTMKSSVQKIEYKEALAIEVKKGLEKVTLDKEKGIREAEQKSARLISELEMQVEKLKASLQVSDYTSQKLREQLSQSQQVFSETLQEISRQKEIQYEKEIERLTAQHRLVLEGVERSSKESLEGMRLMYQEKEDRLRKQYEKVLGSSERGKVGEREFDELVSQYTTWGSLTNTAKTAHSADRQGMIRNCSVRFEIKNYTNDIPSSEVTKFERDMEENADCPLGVFISLNTGITGKKSNGFMSMKWTDKSQMLIYINNFYSHSVEDCLKFIDMAADIAHMVYKAQREHPEQSEVAVLLQMRIDQAKVYVENEVKRMDGLYTALNHDKKFLLDTINRQYANYIYNTEQCASSLRSMLGVLMGTVVETREGLLEVVPAEVAAPKRRGKKTQQKLDGAV